MNFCTLVVDDIIVKENSEKYLITPFDGIKSFFEDFSITNLCGGWQSTSMKLINAWGKTNNFNIVTIEDFDTDKHLNPHYLILCDGNHHIDSNLLRFIPEKTICFLKTHKAPILFFSPVELIYTITNNENWFLKICDIRDAYGLADCKIKFLHLGTHYDRNGQNLNIEDIYESTGDKNICHLNSVAFLDIWKSLCFDDKLIHKSQIDYFEKNNLFVKFEEHNPKLKNKVFLCLNNRDRFNRVLLLHALDLYFSRVDKKKFLISQNFNFPEDYHLALQELATKEFGKTLGTLMNNSMNTALVDKMLMNVDNEIFKLILELSHSSKNKSYPNPQALLENSIINDMNHFVPWNKDWYIDSYCSIVTETTETFLTNIEIPMITEKVLKPILNYHPFVVFGHNFNNKLLREMGFRTFEQTWFDLPDNWEGSNQTIFDRLYYLLKSIKKLLELTPDALEEKWNTIVPDLKFNRKHLLKTNWIEIQKDLILNSK